MVLQFFGDVDVEIYLEYPLFSSGPSHVKRTAKLEVRIPNVKLIQLKSIRFLISVSSSDYQNYSMFLGFENR